MVKIKGHADPSTLSDLECYHALGNIQADKAAEAACLQSHSALTQPWLDQAKLRCTEMANLRAFYSFSLELQKFRKEYEAHAPASMNPNEPHPMRRASVFSDVAANWDVPHGWSFNIDDAQLAFLPTLLLGN